jgi:hypothetical protein
MKSRKFRKKVVAEEDAEAEDDGPMSMAVPPASVAAREREKQKERKRSEAGRVRLSFGDDEEGHGAAAASRSGKLRPSGVLSAALPSTDAKPATQVSGAGEPSPFNWCSLLASVHATGITQRRTSPAQASTQQSG